MNYCQVSAHHSNISAIEMIGSYQNILLFQKEIFIILFIVQFNIQNSSKILSVFLKIV